MPRENRLSLQTLANILDGVCQDLGFDTMLGANQGWSGEHQEGFYWLHANRPAVFSYFLGLVAESEYPRAKFALADTVLGREARNFLAWARNSENGWLYDPSEKETAELVNQVLSLCLHNGIGEHLIKLEGKISADGRKCLLELVRTARPEVLDQLCDLMADLGLWNPATGFNFGGMLAAEDEAGLQEMFARWPDEAPAAQPQPESTPGS